MHHRDSHHRPGVSAGLGVCPGSPRRSAAGRGRRGRRSHRSRSATSFGVHIAGPSPGQWGARTRRCAQRRMARRRYEVGELPRRRRCAGGGLAVAVGERPDQSRRRARGRMSGRTSGTGLDHADHRRRAPDAASGHCPVDHRRHGLPPGCVGRRRRLRRTVSARLSGGLRPGPEGRGLGPPNHRRDATLHPSGRRLDLTQLRAGADRQSRQRFDATKVRN